MSLLTSIVAMAMGHWGNSNSNGNGATIDLSIERRQSITQLQWHQGRGTGATGATGATRATGGNGNGATAMIDHCHCD
jgi:hypothetical protein